MSNFPSVFPAISAGYMAAPRLTHVLETATHGKNKDPYPFHFKKTKKERGELLTLRANWKAQNEAAWKRKEFIINKKFVF